MLLAVFLGSFASSCPWPAQGWPHTQVCYPSGAVPSPQLDTSLTLTSTTSIVGLLPVSLGQSQQEQACFRWWVVLPLWGGKVQEGARPSSSHTIRPPYSGSQFAKRGTCVHPGMTRSFGQTSRLSGPLYFTFPELMCQWSRRPAVIWPYCVLGTLSLLHGYGYRPESLWDEPRTSQHVGGSWTPPA